MARGVRLYLVGSVVLVSLAGCGRGFFQSAEREPWRAEAEITCLKSGAVKESLEIVRIDPITGPGVCGADYPLKVGGFGEAAGSFSFADEVVRPSAEIGNQPRWPVSRPPPPIASQGAAAPQASYPQPSSYPQTAAPQPGYGAPANAPISLAPPGAAPADQDEIDLPPDGMARAGGAVVRGPYLAPASPYSPPYSERPEAAPAPLPPLGPAQGNVAAVGPVAVKPAATLACPIVSVLDHWLAWSVQPAAQRWFGARVVEIKQISAYSCRGMNGNANAHISEHAFGNALDIAAFTLADGRRISVKDGWHGMPEEQGFLRDVQAAACQQFTTVLAPGSNAYHYDHIHVDLMRRASRRVICEPSAVSGADVARAAQQRNPYAAHEVTGSLGGRKEAQRHSRERVNEEDEFEDE
jgi:Extensin-like protein C-terminus